MANLEHWQANVAGLTDMDLLRFIAAVQGQINRRKVALEAAAQEARYRRLLPIEKGDPEGPPSSHTKGGSITVTQESTHANEK